MTNQDQLHDKQLEIEARYKKTAEELAWAFLESRKAEGEASSTALGQRMVAYKFDRVLKGMKDLIDLAIKPKRGVKPTYTPILLEIIEVYKENPLRLQSLLGVITLGTLIDHAMQKKPILSQMARGVGEALRDEVEIDAFLVGLNTANAAKVLGGIQNRNDYYYKTYYARERMRVEGFSFGSNWTKKDLTHLALKLIEVIVEETPYFETFHGSDHRGDTGLELHPTQFFLETWYRNEDLMVSKAYRTCPMVVPPKPWETLRDGGYLGDLSGRNSLLRSAALRGAKDFFSTTYSSRLEQVDLSAVKSAINAIQETPWTINQQVLEVVEQVVARGGNLAGVPQLEPFPKLPQLTGEYTEEQLKKHKREAVKLIKKEQKRKSILLRLLGEIKLAREFVEFDRIWFPHNMDFRGRIYPMTTFSPQGDDLNKGLLLFADVPPLKGPEDLYWLKIHGANLAGIDKVSYQDRIKWVEEHEQQIIESAKDPLGYTWWAEQDDSSWQLLSFCFEWKRLKEFMRDHNGNPAGFLCGIPVAFDGTCSGLQHFSAILRDPVGAEAVNLIPGDKPNDIYGRVAELVNQVLREDAKSGTSDEQEETLDGQGYTKYGTKTLAQIWLAFGVNRKVTKRPVMTLAYGAKEYGYREQIMDDTIKPAMEDGHGGMFEVAPVQCAGYMAGLIWESVQKVVVAAVDGMDWLQKVARLACKGGHVVTWVTPMGLPVQQGYMDMQRMDFKLRFQGNFKRLYSFETTGNIDKRAQVAAVAPNFVHSMDAAHLQKTVLMSKEQQIKHFAMIHDSYGTCPAKAGDLFKVVREAFLQMYTEHDVFEEFLADMEVYFDKKDKRPKMPIKGTLDLQVVTSSPYMFA